MFDVAVAFGAESEPISIAVRTSIRNTCQHYNFLAVIMLKVYIMRDISIQIL
jgi:hypothetical protein